MKVAINSPSLNVKINISGVSSLVNTIAEHNKGVTYIHLLYGRADNEAGFYKRISDIIGSYITVFKLLKNNGCDLVHFNLVLYPKSIYRDVITFAICRYFKKGILIHLHGGTYLLRKSNSPFTTKLIKYMLSKADKVIALSDLERDALVELYNTKNVGILPNAVDNNLFKANGTKRSRSETKFLFLGRLHESKGVQLMIQAFEAVQSKGYPVSLIICGTGELKEYVEAEAKENDAIQYRGVVSDQQRIDAINECHVFLLPSLYGEGLPMALLETMACGLIPVVSTDGSMKLVVKHEVNGLLVKPGDPDELTYAMERTLKDNALMENISKNAQATVAKDYNWNNYLPELNNLYAKICADKTAVAGH